VIQGQRPGPMMRGDAVVWRGGAGPRGGGCRQSRGQLSGRAKRDGWWRRRRCGRQRRSCARAPLVKHKPYQKRGRNSRKGNKIEENLHLVEHVVAQVHLNAILPRAWAAVSRTVRHGACWWRDRIELKRWEGRGGRNGGENAAGRSGLCRSRMERVFIQSRWFSTVHLASCCLPSIKFAKSIDLLFLVANIGQIGNS
jgi:hypothetical protein